MSLAFSISDNADGTGAVATVSGASGAAVTLFTQTFDGDLGAGTWTESGGRTGDGTVDLALAKGHYFVYAAVSGGVSPVYYAVVTDGLAAIEDRIDDAVVARLQVVGLAGIASTRIKKRDVATDNKITCPCITVSSVRQTQDPKAGVLSMDDVVYSEQVTIFDNEDQSHKNGPTYKLWLQQISRAFRNQRLSGVTEVYTCEVVPGPVIPVPDWLAGKFVGALLLKFTAREPRGMSA